MSISPSVAASRRGIVAMSLAMASFVTNDAIVKHVSESLPSAQLIFVRGIMASALVLVVAKAMGATARISEIARGWVATVFNPSPPDSTSTASPSLWIFSLS